MNGFVLVVLWQLAFGLGAFLLQQLTQTKQDWRMRNKHTKIPPEHLLLRKCQRESFGEKSFRISLLYTFTVALGFIVNRLEFRHARSGTPVMVN